MKNLLLLSVFLFSTLFANANDDPTPFGFHFKHKRQRFARIPFESHANLMVVKIRIDKSDTLRFILDTGVSTNIITNTKTAEKLKLNLTRKVQIVGAGESQALSAWVSVSHSLSMGEVQAEKQNIVILDKDVLELSQYLGIPIDGIFGYELFSTFVVQANFDTHELVLTKPQHFKYRPKRHGTRFPMVVTESKPYTDALSLVKNGKETPIRLMIDTGSGHALLLGVKGNVNLPEKVIRANLGKGLNGDLNGHIGRIDKVKLGAIELNNILASFPDSLSFSVKFPSTVENRQGSIGCELLQRFISTFNYQEGYIALLPIRKKLKEGFEHDMSGLEIKAGGNNYTEYYVDDVLQHSPADEAGVKQGDQILFVNNVHTKDLSISDIYNALSKKEGKVVELFLRRNSDFSFVKFQLRRVI